MTFIPGMDTGKIRSTSWPHTGALPVGPHYSRRRCPLCKGKDILGNGHPNLPTLVHHVLPAWVQMWLQKAKSGGPYPALPAGKGQVLGWGGTAASPRALQARVSPQAGLAQLFREPSGAAQWLWLLTREARESKTSPSS